MENSMEFIMYELRRAYDTSHTQIKLWTHLVGTKENTDDIVQNVLIEWFWRRFDPIMEEIDYYETIEQIDSEQMKQLQKLLFSYYFKLLSEVLKTGLVSSYTWRSHWDSVDQDKYPLL